MCSYMNEKFFLDYYQVCAKVQLIWKNSKPFFKEKRNLRLRYTVRAKVRLLTAGNLTNKQAKLQMSQVT